MSRIPDASIIHSRLRLRQLRLMLALEELGSLRRAADEIGMTQPAATKMLHEAETCSASSCSSVCRAACARRLSARR